MTTTTDKPALDPFLVEQLRTDLIDVVKAANSEGLLDIACLLRLHQLENSGAVPGGAAVPWGADEFEGLALVAQQLDMLGHFDITEASAQLDWAVSRLGEATRTAIDSFEGDWGGAIAAVQNAEWDLRAAMDRASQRGREA